MPLTQRNYFAKLWQKKAMSNVNINPRYLHYKKAEVEAILDKVKEIDQQPTSGCDYSVSSGGVRSELDKYTTSEALAVLLGQKQDTVTVATEADMRSLVTDYTEDGGDE